ncbi:MAG: ABC transporter ATP-binding protein [Anaerolineae bacterium]|nr:ABC transporter ATP-binding protein [Anaerolineae bacterium]MCO5193684.1 ABC transporter ATP-binding protein [Anaerolineae bacterium]MCO5206556.1 ABC transporter ATP-binding protein [Anaerolineae bacterium]
MSDNGKNKVEREIVLRMTDVCTYYGAIRALNKINIEIRKGEMVCLLGGNASGKSTTLKTILGYAPPREGTIEFLGTRTEKMQTKEIVGLGVSLVPENRRLFGRMSVLENLKMGAFLRNDDEIEADMEHLFTLFPRVKERLHQTAGTLSGGEQQMVAMSRALMARPKLLLMDEPSMGLAPIFVQTVFDIIQTISNEGTTIFMVEQNANMALSIADKGYVLQTGEIVLSGSAEALRTNPQMKKAYLGDV